MWGAKWLTIGAASLVAAIALPATRSCSETEEARVGAVLAAIEAGIEGRNLGAVMPHISEAYKDGDGLRKDEIRAILAGEILRNKRIAIQRVGERAGALRGPKDERTEATAAFRARFAEGTVRAALGGGDTWDFEVDLRKEAGEWRVVSHRRREAR